MVRFHVNIMMMKDFYLHHVSMALIVICFADILGSATNAAESTSTDLGSLSGRHPIFFTWCDRKYQDYKRARRYISHAFIAFAGRLAY